MLDVNAVFKAYVFITLALAFHGAARYAGANRSKEHGSSTEQEKESFHYCVVTDE